MANQPLKTPKEAHLKKANNNKNFGLAQEPKNQTYACWRVTALFYSALHFVQAYFCTIPLYPETHTERRDLILNDAQLASIKRDYSDLRTLAEKARYQTLLLTQSDVKQSEELLERIEAHVLNLIAH